MKEAIGEAIARLPEREKLVVTLYYYEELTLREIGEVLGVTESRVSQLHTKAILRLKARLSGVPRARRRLAGRSGHLWTDRHSSGTVGARPWPVGTGAAARIRSAPRGANRAGGSTRMAAVEPGKIRNVAVVGHRGTGKTSLVEAMLFQSGAVNRLGHDRGGLHRRRLGRRRAAAPDVPLRRRSATLEWQGRKINLVDAPGDPGFQGDAIAALRVVEGGLFVVSGVMGVEVGTSRLWNARDRARPLPRRLREHARPRARRLLPRARGAAQRSSPSAASPSTCRSGASTS